MNEEYLLERADAGLWSPADEVIDGAVEDLAEESRDMPAVLTHREANYIVKRIGEERRQMLLIDDQEKDEIERIRARAAELREAHQKRDNWLLENYGQTLEQFARDEVSSGKAKSVALLSGAVGFRKNPASLEIIDADAALLWAKQCCSDAVKITETVQKGVLKAHVEETGEVPPGIEYKAAYEKFYIKT